MESNAQLLEANERFYRAFREADIKTMESLWDLGPDVACVHPGRPALRGRERVMASWRAVMLDHPPPQVQCAREEVFHLGDVAFITCVERVPEVDSELVATNVFIRRDNQWLLIHHHSGPLRMPQGLTRPEAADDEPITMN
ncbi:MAG: nuclear transport factor 2 family protein [Myxococcota bacterium]